MEKTANRRSTTEMAVQTEDLVKTFGDKRAVDGVSLEVKRGEIFGVLGPNGAGKTTTLRMLATLLPIDGGSAKVFGVDVRKHAHTVRGLIGLTGQYASVDEDLSATENLRMIGRLYGLSSTAAKKKAENLLEQFSLEEAANRSLSKFSGGMRRRLDLATSLIARPPLVFLDEPTTGLDPRTRGQMWQTIRDLVSEGTTILLTTQYLEEADHLADRIAVIDQGKMVAQGTPDQLKSTIGDSKLQIDLVEPADLIPAADLVGAVLGRTANIDPELNRLSVSLPQTRLTSAALASLDNAQIAVNSLQVSKPSLDEVFLAITGTNN